MYWLIGLGLAALAAIIGGILLSQNVPEEP